MSNENLQHTNADPITHEERALTPSEHDISAATPEERKSILERVLQEQDETWASEALEIDQPFSATELDQLVSVVKDPLLSAQVLHVDETSGRKLSDVHQEKLFAQIETEEGESAAYELYVNLVETADVEEGPTEKEVAWRMRLEKFLSDTGHPFIAEYLLQNAASLGEEGRARLTTIAHPE